MSFVANQFVYHEGSDERNEGLLIPRYRAVGRTSPKGEVYRAVSKQDESELVLVRSIVSKSHGDLSTVTPDLIKKGFGDFTDGAAIGLSLSTSLTESVSQSLLALKHGGHERVLEQGGLLKAPADCKFSEDGKWIILTAGKKKYKYPKPDALVKMDKDEFTEGESTCCLYNTVSPGYKLNALINLMRARPSIGLRFYEKDNIIISDCYAFEDGKIEYREDKNGNIDVYIGDTLYQYNPNCMYYFPDGAKVKKFDRICSGVINMNSVTNHYQKDLSSIYLCFRKQFYELVDGGFAKSGILSDSSYPEEIVEIMFTGMTRVDYTCKKDKIADIEFQGAQKSVLSKKSFYTVLSYGYGSRIVGKALKGELNLSGDIMTETVLGLLMNNKLDD